MTGIKSNILCGLAAGVLVLAAGCARPSKVGANDTPSLEAAPEAIAPRTNPGRVIHVLVALCDNEFQGIVPVPAHLGDGDDPDGNLYWGAAYGVKTFFSKSPKWTKLAEFNDPKDNVLRRMVFRYSSADVYLVADAYRGRKIRETTADFFKAVSGDARENISAGGLKLQILGGADLVAFVGHNGLMDFEPGAVPANRDDRRRDAIVLACASRNYFAKPLERAGAKPLLWTSNLMAPEAYILHGALEGWIAGETDEQIRMRAAAEYARYQKISLSSAKNLLVTGW